VLCRPTVEWTVNAPLYWLSRCYKNSNCIVLYCIVPDFDIVVNKLWRHSQQRQQVSNCVLKSMCQTRFQLCFKTFFICTINASKVIFVTFNLNCWLHAVSVGKPSARGCQIFVCSDSVRIFYIRIRTEFRISAHPYFYHTLKRLIWIQTGFVRMLLSSFMSVIIKCYIEISWAVVLHSVG